MSIIGLSSSCHLQLWLRAAWGSHVRNFAYSKRIYMMLVFSLTLGGWAEFCQRFGILWRACRFHGRWIPGLDFLFFRFAFAAWNGQVQSSRALRMIGRGVPLECLYDSKDSLTCWSPAVDDNLLCSGVAGGWNSQKNRSHCFLRQHDTWRWKWPGKAGNRNDW